MSIPGTAGAPAPRHKLFLVFSIGQDRFALQAAEIAEVLPRLALKPIARSPGWVAGIFAHRGQMVPVIDLSQLAFGHPAAARTSTRLVLVHYRTDPRYPERLLGLVLEHANETLRCSPDEFRSYGLNNREAPYLGPVREDAQGMMQWVRVGDLLSEAVCELLYMPADTDEVGP
ncbi:chemotaxis protein CheW [Pseudomonas sp. dw_358]|uniref:chemotaxis protein CheW n=1 Tax=Pseudomonas sp. dw_358 TaxID=2720083 RepID=UPI001BD3FF7C|nr:chemotaxis protein CheW [Pseudomonas sp. dw_358]